MPPVAAHRAWKAVPRGPSVPAPVEAGAVAHERAGRVTPGAVAHELRAGRATMLPVATPVQAARCCPPARCPGPLPRPPLPDSGRKSDGALGQKSAGPAGGPAPGTSLGEPAHARPHQLRGRATGQPPVSRCKLATAWAPRRPLESLHGPLHRSAAVPYCGQTDTGRHDALRAIAAMQCLAFRVPTLSHRLGDAPDMTPEEHNRRGDAADALWRELVRQVAACPSDHDGRPHMGDLEFCFGQ